MLSFPSPFLSVVLSSLSLSLSPPRFYYSHFVEMKEIRSFIRSPVFPISPLAFYSGIDWTEILILKKEKKLLLCRARRASLKGFGRLFKSLRECYCSLPDVD